MRNPAVRIGASRRGLGGVREEIPLEQCGGVIGIRWLWLLAAACLKLREVSFGCTVRRPASPGGPAGRQTFTMGGAREEITR
jgi:hypothetical protein